MEYSFAAFLPADCEDARDLIRSARFFAGHIH
jgi:hypothetical protein